MRTRESSLMQHRLGQACSAVRWTQNFGMYGLCGCRLPLPLAPLLTSCCRPAAAVPCCGVLCCVVQADQKRAKFFQAEGDHITLLAVYEAWKANKFSNPWCHENFIQVGRGGACQGVAGQTCSACALWHRLPEGWSYFEAGSIHTASVLLTALLPQAASRERCFVRQQAPAFSTHNAGRCVVLFCDVLCVQARAMKRAQDVRKQLIAIMDRYKLDLVSAGKNYVRICKAITSGFFFHAARKDPQEVCVCVQAGGGLGFGVGL